MSENVIIPPETEAFNDFDLEFGAFLNRYARNSSVELAATGMLLSRELRNGIPQLDLNEYAGKTIALPDGKTVTLPETQAWLETLFSPEMGGVAVPETEDDGKSLLLVFKDRILMMRRYAMLEKELAMQLERRKGYRDTIVNDFAGGGDWVQDLAVFMALNSKLTILTGGPGTGKTSVCGRIIRELLRRDPEL
ncbi:MAG: AAA family ATPase, partial [Lentisphaeria bacterium]|nr:AAA family ATPase [Lentisphaeria bacterium]